MSNATDKKEKTVPLNINIPESLQKSIMKIVSKRIDKGDYSVTKTEVSIELLLAGLQYVK